MTKEVFELRERKCIVCGYPYRDHSRDDIERCFNIAKLHNKINQTKKEKSS